ncbi:MAG TPA: NIPSNAP family protein [Usitatibacter sp.]|nr:NIPSNAP family protein [Usitatibacter sp.]
MDQAVVIIPAVETSPIVELRQYTLHPDKRDVLMTLFEKKFVTPQQELGIRLHGEFRDVDDPNRFVWLRGFRNMEERARTLDAFYGGPAWKENRNEANATMVDSDNVLLLQPADGEGFTLARKMTATMVATIYLLQAPVDATFMRYFKERVVPVVTEAGAPPVAELKTLAVKNNFPKLPIREGENAFVWFSAFDNDDQLKQVVEKLDSSPAFRAMDSDLRRQLVAAPVHLILHPTQQALDRSREPYRYSLDVKGGVHDFDFVEGEWTSKQWRLKERGVGSNEWEPTTGKHWAKVLLGGVANVDTVEFPEKGWAGSTYRNFDKAASQWNIYWVNSRDGHMDYPGQVGGFSGNVGLFYGNDKDGDRPVRVVYRWEKQGASHARWEQAFSYDDGKTWETNWVMEMTKVR